MSKKKYLYKISYEAPSSKYLTSISSKRLSVTVGYIEAEPDKVEEAIWDVAGSDTAYGLEYQEITGDPGLDKLGILMH